MTQYDYDLFTIGAGSGGVRASRFAGGFGARVAIAEERYLGGTCVNVGCVPKKLFVYAAEFAHDFEDAAGFGWTVGERTFDWPTLIHNKNQEINRLNGIYERLLNNAGVDIINGRARIIDEHTVEVDGQQYTSEYILVATGGWPRLPEIPGVEHAITSNEAFYLEQLPERMIIVGGGYIAVEFAGVFNNLGVEVTMLHRGNLILRGFDDDIRDTLETEMSKQGIEVRCHEEIVQIEKDGETLTATLKSGDTLTAGAIMYAIGRVPNTTGIGLEAAGVELNEKGAIVVNEYLQSSVPHIYALGDVIDRIQLTPMATAEGMAVARNLFDGQAQVPAYDNVPTAIFSHPNVGTVGLTEAEARHQYKHVDIYRTKFRPMKHTLSGREERVMMKLVVDADTDKVLGVHMVGPEAGETIQGFAVALKAGATKAVFDSTIGIHPTAAEEFVTMRTKVLPVAPQELGA